VLVQLQVIHDILPVKARVVPVHLQVIHDTLLVKARVVPVQLQVIHDILPVKARVVQVIHDILPMKARSEVDRLLSELQDAQFKLEFEPTTTIEYVESLMLLDEIHERVSPLMPLTVHSV